MNTSVPKKPVIADIGISEAVKTLESISESTINTAPKVIESGIVLVVSSVSAISRTI